MPTFLIGKNLQNKNDWKANRCLLMHLQKQWRRGVDSTLISFLIHFLTNKKQDPKFKITGIGKRHFFSCQKLVNQMLEYFMLIVLMIRR